MTAGWLLALAGPPVLTVVLLQQRGLLGLATDLLFFITLVVGTALVGGLFPALACAVLGSSLLNYFFTEPTGGLTISDPEQALAVVLFTLVALAVASLVEVAERMRTRALRAAELEHAAGVRTALLTAASHDLRSPLATIRTAVDGLAVPGPSPSERRELVEAIDASTSRLERLIDNLLDLSMLHTGALSPELRAASLEEFVPAAVEGAGEGHAHRVALDLDEGLPDVRTDPGLLERVLANVIGNALRFTAERVEVRAAVRTDSVEVHVVDHGPGVTTSARGRMFEPFQRLDDVSPGPRPPGLGLGLAAAQGLSAAVGARLEARDTPGGGLTMVLVVPRDVPPVEVPA